MQPSIADIVYYTDIAYAPQGNVALSDYAHVRGWRASIEALPRFIGMPRTAVGLRAS